MAITYLENNLVCMDCGETNLFVVKLYPRYDISVSDTGLAINLDDVELEQEFADIAEKQLHENYEGWIMCGRCGSDRIAKRYENTPALNGYYSPLIPTEDVNRVWQYLNTIKKEEQNEAKVYKSKL